MITFACVLKTGGRYDWRWVEKLQRGVDAHYKKPRRFVCLTDADRHISPAIQTLPLRHGWPGWWSKIELFDPRNDLTGPTLFFDLDTLIVGDLTEIAHYRHGFTMAHEFYRPHLKCSTAMAWTGDHSTIYRAFAADPRKWMDEYIGRKDGRIGDQAFIEDVMEELRQPVDTFRALFDEKTIASYKVDGRAGPPPNAVAVAFHGEPKMDQAHAGWGRKMWDAL